jgi:hypothetical protein
VKKKEIAVNQQIFKILFQEESPGEENYKVIKK